MAHTHKRAALGLYALSLLPLGVSTLALYNIQLVGRYVILINSHSIFLKIIKVVVPHSQQQSQSPLTLGKLLLMHTRLESATAPQTHGIIPNILLGHWAGTYDTFLEAILKSFFKSA